MRPPRYRVHGMMQSYFTRKMTGYLDYKGIPWTFCRFAGVDPVLAAAGFPGGVPALQAPDGTAMWDSTPMIHHLERAFPEPSVLPDDPVLRFLAYVLEDAADEWYYRPAVGSRWFFPENHAVGGWELARDMSVRMPIPCAQAYLGVGEHVRGSCPPLGITAETIGRWIDEILRPWFRVLGAHLASEPYLLGARPALADFAFFGGNAAHFVNDPLCRGWVEADGPAIVQHTHRLMEPDGETFGAWLAPGVVPETLIAVLRELGTRYLPWVSRACVDGAATIAFTDGTTVEISPTAFLRDARATLLARYVAHRSPALDAVLDRAGILAHFAGYTEHAGAIPDDRTPPQPRLNRPFPPAWEVASA